MSNKQILRWYRKHNMELLPVRPKDKRPRDSGWRTNQYTDGHLLGWMVTGGNLGYRIGPDEVVIDVDPRNYRDGDSLEKLHKDLDLPKFETIGVTTGGGGLHYYFKLPNIERYKNELSDKYPGIEIKAHGKYVVAAGSTHPETGRPYQLFENIENLKHAEIPEQIRQTYRSEIGGPSSERQIIDTAQLSELLKQLDVYNYDTNDSWFRIMAASHGATEGAGIEEFVEWSIGDSQYANSEDEIRARWRSLGSSGKINLLGLGALLREIQKAGGNIDDFQREQTATAFAESIPEEVPSANGFDALMDEIQGASEMKPHLVMALAKKISTYSDPAAREALLLELKRRSKFSLSMLRKAARPPTEDLADMAATKLLNDRFFGGEHLIRAIDGNYWTYTGKHWRLWNVDLLKKEIDTHLIESALCSNSNLTHASALDQIEKILRARTARDADLFSPPPVNGHTLINCSNGTVYLDNSTGAVDLRPHDPRDYVLSMLTTDYDPKAECPMFDKALKELMSPLPDGEQVIELIWELYGYTIQCKKDLPLFCLFQGEGENGKTFVLEVLTRLLGESSLNDSIGQYDTSKNRFAFDALVGKLALIDDDVNKDTILPDGFLKTTTENKRLTAEPKGGKKFGFVSQATVFLASNHWPKTRDLSKGMRRRMCVIPFRFDLTQHGIDPQLKYRIFDQELSGVLRKAIEAFQRMRRRGRFLTPPSCLAATREWEVKANPASLFMEELYKTADSSVSVENLWATYQAWCLDVGARRTYTRPGLVAAVKEMGYKLDGKQVQNLQRRTDDG